MKYSLALLLIASVVPAVAADSPFAFRETSATGLELTENGKPVFVYNFGMILAPGFPKAMQRSCYLHPVYAPDGTLLTRDFDPDHAHHRGIFWAWPDVTANGKNGDMWTLEGDKVPASLVFQQKFVRWIARDVEADHARLVVENGWFDGDHPFVKENVDIVVHSAVDNQRVLDFTISLEALDKPVQIKGIAEGNKWFGGFGFRFAPRDGGEKATLITTEKGVSKKDEVYKKHHWAQVSGKFNGKPAGGRMDDDPSNPGYPNPWLLRHKFGLLNPCYPGSTQITLAPGKPLVLKYRVTLFAGETAE